MSVKYISQDVVLAAMTNSPQIWETYHSEDVCHGPSCLCVPIELSPSSTCHENRLSVLLEEEQEVVVLGVFFLGGGQA